MSGQSDRYGMLDVVLVIGYAAMGVIVDLLPFGSVVRFVVLLPLLLFLPGYALSTVLFPGGQSERKSALGRQSEASPAIDGVERAALGIGLSVALLPLFGLLFAVAFGTVNGPIVPAAAAFVALTAILGAVRRARRPENQRFGVLFGQWLAEARAAVTSGSRFDVMTNLALAASVLLAAGVLAVGFAAPQQGATFTEFAVGTTDDGEFVTSGYPTELDAGEEAELNVLIENREGEPITYTTVVQLERVEDGAVTERSELDMIVMDVAPGETATEQHTIAPMMTGQDLRLTYLLYIGEPDPEPDRESAYRSAHVWITVRG